MVVLLKKLNLCAGKEEGIWHLDLKNGDGVCGKGEPKAAPDATLTMDSGNFADMFAGKASTIFFPLYLYPVDSKEIIYSIRLYYRVPQLFFCIVRTPNKSL